MFIFKGSRLLVVDVKNIIFFVRFRLELMDIIVENVFRYFLEFMCGVKEVGFFNGFIVLRFLL